MNKYAVIMAGGGGTRFWPLSRQTMPKQMLNLSGNDIMINETISRNSGVIPLENVYIVTNRSQEKILKNAILKGVRDENILLEPVARNTAACIGFAAVAINKRHGESVICVLPSDAYINDVERYTKVLNLACECAKDTDKIVTIGIKPVYPATGYGYIKHGQAVGSEGAYLVEEFVEKPDFEKARAYLRDGNYLWSCGIIVWRTSVILENIKRFLPKLYRQLEILGQFIDTQDQDRAVDKVYSQLQSISIDYGILERSDNILAVPGEFGWNDIGTWDALGAMFPPDENGNIIRAEHIGIDTKNSIVFGNKLITTIGLENMIVVNTDDAMLICPKSRTQEVKRIVDILKENSKSEYI